MRLRKKWWARPEMEASPLVITNPKECKGQWQKVFDNNNHIYLELGCGMGKFISERAELNPDTNFIGIDLYDNVIVYALRKVIEKELSNVRFIPMDIMEIGNIFDTDEISRIYINFCNPWPKRSHSKRRLTHPNFLAQYVKFLKADSEIWFKTDDDDLFEASIKYFEDTGFKIKYLSRDLHSSDFEDNIVTEYESKFTSLGIKTKFAIVSRITE